jgi:hypothetical protein
MVLILLAIFFHSSSFAIETDDTVLGQKNFSHYMGPTYPILKIDFYKKSMSFDDKEYYSNYINHKVQNEIFLLNDYFSGEFSQGLSCPDYQYFALKDDIHFYIRLISLSYLDQALNEYGYNLKRLGAENICFSNPKNLIQKCDAKSSMMKNFVKNALKISKNEIQYIPFEQGKKSSVESWIKEIKFDFPKYLSQRLVKDNCLAGKCETPAGVKSKLNIVCNEHKKLFLSICSEADQNFGLSYIPELHFSLTSRPTFLSQQNSYFSGCLKRFIESNSLKEYKVNSLKQVFKYKIDENLRKGKLQGELFRIGELSEIHKKGLREIFKGSIQKAPLKNSITMKDDIRPKFEKIILPAYIEKKTKKIIKKKREILKVKAIEKESAFYIAAKFRKKFDANQVKVDMKKFKYDYTFDLAYLRTYGATINKFSSLKSLKDMKHYDNLGSKDAPIPLKFLKFLIENEKHQNLFNIIQVLGEQFFVENNIDKVESKLEKVSIENSHSTGNQWQISILKAD